MSPCSGREDLRKEAGSIDRKSCGQESNMLEVHSGEGSNAGFCKEYVI